MNHILTIIKKELKRFFTDKRMLISLFAPGILIFVLYSFMGSFINSALTNDPSHEYIIYVNSTDESVTNLLETSDYKISFKKGNNDDDIKSLFENEQCDLYVSFTDDFSNAINNNLSPNIDIYYNSSNLESSAIYQYYLALLTPGSINNVDYKYKINMKENIQYDFATKEESSIMIITMMVPYLLIIFLFTGCLSIASEAIAGEKERGTIASLLVTPVKRTHIAIGKVIALSITSLASSLVSFACLMGSLPNLIGNSDEMGITLSMYNTFTYLQILAIIMVTVILFTVILSIISTYARSVKESSQFSSIIMVFVMISGVSSLVGVKSIITNPIIFTIPIYNCVQCLSGILSLQLSPINFLITIISNLVYIFIGIKIIATMFNSEKIVFNK